MQLPPLTFSDLSLLFAVGSFVLLITAELASPNFGLKNLAINKTRLQRAALITSLGFLITFAVYLLNLFVNS